MIGYMYFCHVKLLVLSKNLIFKGKSKRKCKKHNNDALCCSLFTCLEREVCQQRYHVALLSHNHPKLENCKASFLLPHSSKKIQIYQ